MTFQVRGSKSLATSREKRESGLHPEPSKWWCFRNVSWNDNLFPSSSYFLYHSLMVVDHHQEPERNGKMKGREMLMIHTEKWVKLRNKTKMVQRWREMFFLVEISWTITLLHIFSLHLPSLSFLSFSSFYLLHSVFKCYLNVHSFLFLLMRGNLRLTIVGVTLLFSFPFEAHCTSNQRLLLS